MSRMENPAGPDYPAPDKQAPQPIPKTPRPDPNQRKEKSCTGCQHQIGAQCTETGNRVAVFVDSFHVRAVAGVPDLDRYWLDCPLHGREENTFDSLQERQVILGSLSDHISIEVVTTSPELKERYDPDAPPISLDDMIDLGRALQALGEVSEPSAAV
jgi:hypothetical protein